jgi:hypothetical protein
MIYENELPTWKVTQIVSGNDNFVKFAFENNECTTHDIDDKNDVEITLNK